MVYPIQVTKKIKDRQKIFKKARETRKRIKKYSKLVIRNYAKKKKVQRNL